MSIDSALGTAHIDTLGYPSHFIDLHPATKNVTQFVLKTQKGGFFVTQATNGSNGTRDPFESTIISRMNSKGVLLDSMALYDAGHGMSVNIEYGGISGRPWITMTWQAPVSGGKRHDLVKFPYKKGHFFRHQIKELKVLPQFEGSENIYTMDWKKDYLVSRHFHFDGSGETYSRRKISDLRKGINKTYGKITLPTNPPTMQGFCTVNDTFFRYSGVGNVDEKTTNDPIKLEQYNWNTGELVASVKYPNLGKTDGEWPNDHHEPESVSIFREKDGRATLLLGLVVGVGASRKYPVYAFRNIGSK